MKSLERIKNRLQSGDYELIATGLGKSPNTIKAIVHGYRRDIDDMVKEAFEILFTCRGKTEGEVLAKLKELQQKSMAA
jgi:hypothetical protein